MKLKVPDMTCGHCEATIKKEILKNDKAAEVKVDLKAKEVEVSTKLSQAELISVLDQIGYDAAILNS